MLKLKTSLTALVTGLTFAAPLAAETILSSWLDPTQPITQYAHQEWADDLRERTSGEGSVAQID